MLEKLPVAFLAGLVTVDHAVRAAARARLPAAISAVEVERLGEPGTSRRIVISSIPFIIGFTIVFVILGAGAAAIASTVDKNTQETIAGFILVVIGLAFVGLLPIPERALAPGLVSRARTQRLGEFCSAARSPWSSAPCIGTVLASILAVASTSGGVTRGVILLFGYSLGLGAAFVIAGVAFAHAMKTFRWVRSHYRALQVASGVHADRARAAALLQPRLVAADRARSGLREDRPQHVVVVVASTGG